MWPTTPLIYASKMGHRDMAALLMDRGADVAATYKVRGSMHQPEAQMNACKLLFAVWDRSKTHGAALSSYPCGLLSYLHKHLPLYYQPQKPH
jgi:ankyrin repeat protein